MRKPSVLFSMFALALLCTACPPVEEPDDDDSAVAPDDDDDTTADDDDTTADDDDATGELPSVRVAQAADGEALKGGSATIAPDGSILVVWVSEVGDHSSIYLARSTDDGATFGDPVQVESDGALQPIAGSARRPYVTADADRVAVTFNTYPDPATYGAVADLAALTFAAPVAVGTTTPNDFEDYAKAGFTPDGDIVVVTHTTIPASQTDQLFVSRESGGWVAADVTVGVPGEPCACCPLDLFVRPSGDALIAYRNNIDDDREQWVLFGEDFGEAVQASTTGFVTSQCPVQGPRMSEGPDGQLLLAWSDPTSGDGRIWMAESTDGAATWTDQRILSDDVGGQHRQPRVGTTDSGTIHVAFEVTGQGGIAFSSADDGATWSLALPLATPDGVILEPELVVAGGLAIVVGAAGDQGVWSTRLE